MCVVSVACKAHGEPAVISCDLVKLALLYLMHMLCMSAACCTSTSSAVAFLLLTETPQCTFSTFKTCRAHMGQTARQASTSMHKPDGNPASVLQDDVSLHSAWSVYLCKEAANLSSSCNFVTILVTLPNSHLPWLPCMSIAQS